MDINRYLDFERWVYLISDTGLWLFWTVILLSLGGFVSDESNLPSTFPHIVDSPQSIRIAIFFLLLVVLVHLTKVFWQYLCMFPWRNRPYKFNSKDWPNKWIFNGKTELSKDNYLLIKSSRSGSLLKNYNWKNFEMDFWMKFNYEDKFGIQKRLGLVFRAKDLDNYFMLEISEKEEIDDNDKDLKTKVPSTIKSHVRFRGGWEGVSVTEIKNVEFDFSKFTKITLEVVDEIARVYYDNERILIFEWTLPSYVDVNHWEAGVKQPTESRKEQDSIGRSSTGHVQEIPFRLKYGLIGFRSHWNHAGTYIRNLKIRPLQ